MKDVLATLSAIALLSLFAAPFLLVVAPVYLLFGTVLYGSWVVFGIVLFFSWSARCFFSLLTAKAVPVKVLVSPSAAHQGDSF